MVSRKFLLRFFFLNSFLILSACSSSQLIRDVDYQPTHSALKKLNTDDALLQFPKKERGGFITSIEKSWLTLWSGSVDQGDLLAQAKTLDERKFTSITRETEHFFFNETQEGYLPAEHEIIAMHLISAMNFMQQNKFDEAYVEAKSAAYFLQSIFNDDQNHFDDPALRTWLAGVWAALGEWDEARVDFRKIYELTRNKKAREWAERNSPPKELNIVFEGAGPDLKWEKENPIPEFQIQDAGLPGDLSFSSEAWYARHKVRNSALREQILKSNYMSQYYGIQLGKKSEQAMGITTNTALKITGVVLATVLIGGTLYIVAESHVSNAGEGLAYILTGELLLGKYLWDQGTKIGQHFDESAENLERKGLEDLRTYRFVRFLPNWISVAEYQAPSTWWRTLNFKSVKSPTTVHFIQKF